MNCTHCGSPNTDNRGDQKGICPLTRRWYSYPLYQCNGCETSFAVAAQKRFLDGERELVPAKTEVLA